jgi:hypothetical protein
MVQVSEFAQWRFADGPSTTANDPNSRSAANKRNEDHAQPPPPPNLKWNPKQGRAAAKARAKEMRKAVEQRAERREASRHAADARTSERVAATDAGDATTSAASAAPAGLAPPTATVSHDKLPPELWLLILGHADVPTLAACALCGPLRSLTSTPSLWRAAHSRLFGAAPVAESPRDGPSEPLRAACVESEGMLRRFTRAAAAEPQALPLPAMNDVSLAGRRGVSVHEGKIVRVWDAASGRRLECRSSARHQVCCHATEAGDAVGDASGFLTITASGSSAAADDDHHEGAGAGAGRAEWRASQHALVSVRLLPCEGPVAVASDDRGAVSCWRQPEEEGRWSLVAERLSLAEQPPGGGYGLAAWSDASFFHSRPTGEVEGWGLHGAGLRAQWRGAPTPEDEAAAALLRPPAAAANRPRAARLASFEPRLGLLAAATGPAVALWDPRAGGGAAGGAALPVARVPLGRPAAFVVLDRGHGGAVAPYHLLASAGAGVLVFDIRRLGGGACSSPAAASSSPRLSPSPLVATLTRPRGAGLGACFDAEGGAVVAGGGPKGACAFRWPAASDTAAPAEEAVAARGEPRRQERPKRQPSGAKGRNKG